MIANHDNMLVAFCLYNEKYFEGKLLFPQFDLSCCIHIALVAISSIRLAAGLTKLCTTQ